jgi:hypothetical protein
LIVSSDGLREPVFAELPGERLSTSALGLAAPSAVEVGERDLSWKRRESMALAAPQTSGSAAATLELDRSPGCTKATGNDRAVAPVDICVLQLNLRDLRALSSIIERVRARVRPGGKILALHLAEPPGQAEPLMWLLQEDTLALDLPCRLHIVGSRASVAAIKIFRRAAERLNRRRPAAAVLGLAQLAMATLLARCCNARRGAAPRGSAVFTSLTIAIDIPETPA